MIKLKYKLNDKDANRIREAYKHVSETFSKINFDYMLVGLENIQNIKEKINENIVISKMKDIKVYKPCLELAINRLDKEDRIVMTINRANYLENKSKKNKEEYFSNSFIKMTLFSSNKENTGYVLFIDFGSQRYPYFFNFQIGGAVKEDGTLKRFLSYFSEFDNSLKSPIYRQIKKNKEKIKTNYGEYFEKNIEKLFSVKIPKIEKIDNFDFSKQKKITFVKESKKIRNREKYCTLIYSPFPEEIIFNIDNNNMLNLWIVSRKMDDEEIKKKLLETDCLNLWFKILYKEYIYGKNIMSKFKSEILLQQ